MSLHAFHKSDIAVPTRSSAKHTYLVVIVGPTCSGKTTLAERFVAEKGYGKIVTTTTRDPREGEVNGVDYHFVSEEQFKAGIEAGDFLEHATFGDNLYGITKTALDKAAEEGAGRVVSVNEIKGWQTLELLNHSSKHEDLSVSGIFLDASPETLGRRLRERDDYKNYAFRLYNICRERKNIRHFLNGHKPHTRVLFEPTQRQLTTFLADYLPYDSTKSRRAYADAVRRAQHHQHREQIFNQSVTGVMTRPR